MKKYIIILFILFVNISYAQKGNYVLENDDVKLLFNYSFVCISDSVAEFIVSSKVVNKSNAGILMMPLSESTYYPFADEFMFGAQTAFGGSVRSQYKYLTILNKDSFMLMDDQTIVCRIEEGNINALSMPIEYFWFTFNYILLDNKDVSIDELEFNKVYYDKQRRIKIYSMLPDIYSEHCKWLKLKVNIE